MLRWARLLWDFSRPHTLVGTSLAVVILYLVAAHETGHADLGLFFTVLVASLGVNVYVTGLNQLTDVDIDRTNKPWLPLAAGRISANDAARVVAISVVLALGLGAAGGGWLLATMVLVGGAGTAYSLPPLRLKRFPVPAALLIIGSRAVVGNLGVWLTFTSELGGQPYVAAHVVLLVVFMLGFMAVIAVLKDVPDMDGDRAAEIQTFSLRVGPARVVRGSAGLVAALYVGMMAAGLWGVPGVDGTTAVVAHLGLLGALGLLYARCDATDGKSVADFYQGIWKLYYLELLVYLIACLRA